MADVPEIAVVIGAYGRESYLLAAVRSVLAQSLPRDRWEILVTKNFERDAIDRSLASEGIPTRLDDDPRIGTWLLRAVHATRAPLVAFLDDDDAFEPGRLSRVLDVFRQHPEVGFYRNRVRVIDADGTAVPRARWRSHEIDAAFDTTGPVLIGPQEKADLVERATARTNVTFNSSTMVVRRELLLGSFGSVFGRTQLPDLGLFLVGALGSYGLFLDDQRLTRFRYYDGNVTRRVAWLHHAAEAHRDFAAFARTRDRPDFSVWLDLTADHYDRMFRGGVIAESVASGAARRAVASLAAQYLRFLARHPRERAFTFDVWAAAAYAAGYLVAPSVAQHVLAARPTARGS